MNVEHSSVKHDWETPEYILDATRKVFGGSIFFDPCTTEENPCQATTWCTPKHDNALGQPYWPGRFYCNPPYGIELRRKGGWVDTLLMQREEGIVLLRSSTSSKWFRKMWDWSDCRCFIDHRVKYRGAPTGAPFANTVFYHGPRPRLFADVFEDLGIIC